MPRVIILGGGPAALATAFDLARDPQYNITVYTIGWRLGGKCASSRNTIAGERNEEHGLHLPLGFYENFFDQISQAYAELGRMNGPLRTVQAALQPRDSLTLTEWFAGTWHEWVLNFPPNAGVAGARANALMNGAPLPTVTLLDAVRQILTWVRGLAAAAALPDEAGDPFEPLVAAIDVTLAALNAMNFAPADPAGGPGCMLGALGSIVEAVTDFIGSLFGIGGSSAAAAPANPVVNALRQIDDMVRPALQSLLLALAPAFDLNFGIRRLWIEIELGITTARGLLALLIAGNPLSSLDDLDFIQWLNASSPLGGLTPVSRNSALVRMPYDLVFGYRNGDTNRPALAAGVALRGLLRLVFDYSGSVAYDLAAGMGETVITAYYQAILNRSPNVTFEFFSPVRQLVLSPDGTRIQTVRIGRQATPAGGPYVPTRQVGGVDVWPSEPIYAALAEGAALSAGAELPTGGYDLESTYTAWNDVGVLDIDVSGAIVVLAVPPTALATVTPQLSAASPTWQNMLANVTGITTGAFQIWTTATTAALGWPPQGPSPPGPALIGAYRVPLGTIADMARVIPYEAWPAGEQPLGSFYFCGPTTPPDPATTPPGSNYPSYALGWFTTQATQWMQNNLNWPFSMLVDAGGNIDYTMLSAPMGVFGANRLSGQYFRIGVNLGEQYITSFPGSIRYRVRPDGRLFANLFLAGDWTDCGMNAGALEAAVTSGRIAARGILQMANPAINYQIYGEGDWVP